MNLLIKTVTSEDSVTPLILRITFAIVLWPYGAQLLLGMFDGNGYTGSMGYFATLGLPLFVSFLVLYFFCFFAAYLFLLGFFMNWRGNQKGGGMKYHLLLIGIVIVLLITGSGKSSLDRIYK